NVTTARAPTSSHRSTIAVSGPAGSIRNASGRGTAVARPEMPAGAGTRPQGVPATPPATAVPRPDAFRIDPAGPLTAIVERCELAGARAVVTFRPEGSPPVRCETAIGEAPVVGATVSVALSPDAVLVFPAD
ncbi:MAG: TOBE domain-containing protein, partial [Actinomycetota bacterium]